MLNVIEWTVFGMLVMYLEAVIGVYWVSKKYNYSGFKWWFALFIPCISYWVKFENQSIAVKVIAVLIPIVIGALWPIALPTEIIYKIVMIRKHKDDLIKEAES